MTATERPAGTTVNNCRTCQYLDAAACQYAGNGYQLGAVARLREKHAPECPDPRGGATDEQCGGVV
ncbi:hypothetical protein [Kitasatospora sp. GAS1066B]|uniref:hypothetical protein n=1 Tax=Kitasatospora sp. GAS1066B TaxID=3156271 RepID=UPI0035186FA9